MPQLLRACALVLLVCAACDAGSEPRVGSPGLEPPHGRDDGGVGEDIDPGSPAGSSAGAGAAMGGSAGSGTPPSAGVSGGAGAGPTTGTAGNASGAGGAGGAGGGTDPLGSSDAGVDSDAGGVPFSELHQAEIMQDCVETVQCYQQRDEPLGPDPLDTCVEDSAALLDENPELQAPFLAIFARCSALIVCDYYDCATMPP